MMRAYLDSETYPRTIDHGHSIDTLAGRWMPPGWPWCVATTAALDGPVWGILYLIPTLMCDFCVEFVVVGNGPWLSAPEQTLITRIVSKVSTSDLTRRFMTGGWTKRNDPLSLQVQLFLSYWQCRATQNLLGFGKNMLIVSFVNWECTLQCTNFACTWEALMENHVLFLCQVDDFRFACKLESTGNALLHQKCKARWYLWGIKYHPAMSW